MIRPAIFLVARIAMLVLRAIMSKNTYGEGELSELCIPLGLLAMLKVQVGELILVSIGYLFLMDPVIEMWRRHIATAVSKEDAPRWVTRLSW